jgi:undecaprenyl-diphosphatase
VRRYLRRLERRELNILLVGLIVSALLFLFLRLAVGVTYGETQSLDERIVRALRLPDNPSVPRGPEWLRYAMEDVTALGSATVLTLVVISISGFLFLRGRPHTALLVLLNSAAGAVAVELLKQFFERPRPSIVPHLRHVVSDSFPSGHAMQSAILYLTLGALMMRVAERRLTKIFCMSMAILLTLLVGMSRVFIGVHYPTDVVGGWILGFLWALGAWAIARRFERVVEEERDEAE